MPAAGNGMLVVCVCIGALVAAQGVCMRCVATLSSSSLRAESLPAVCWAAGFCAVPLRIGGQCYMPLIEGSNDIRETSPC